MSFLSGSMNVLPMLEHWKGGLVLIRNVPSIGVYECPIYAWTLKKGLMLVRNVLSIGVYECPTYAWTMWHSDWECSCAWTLWGVQLSYLFQDIHKIWLHISVSLNVLVAFGHSEDSELQCPVLVLDINNIYSFNVPIEFGHLQSLCL